MRKYLLILVTFLVFTDCAKKPPEPKELYEKYRSSVVLIKNSYYFKVNFDNGLEYFYTISNNEPIIHKDEKEAIQSANTGYGTGFFISERGEIATNRHVIFPNKEEENAGKAIKNRLLEIKATIEKEINEKTGSQGEAADYYNKNYDNLSYEDLKKIRDYYDELKDEIVDLKSYLNVLDFEPSKTKYEVVRLFTGIIYDNHHFTNESDFEECVPLKRDNDEFSDLAIIQLKDKMTPSHVLNYLSIENLKANYELNLEDKVYMIGYNSGLDLAITNEGVKTQFTSGAITQDPDVDRVLYSIPTLSGSSGSPIINQWGELVAINFAKMRDYQGFSFGVPVNKLKTLYTNNSSFVNASQTKTKSISNATDVKVSRQNNISSSSSNEDFSKNIKGLLMAEESRDFEKIYPFFSRDIQRYWSLNSPSYYELLEQYEKSWKVTSGSNNTVKNIIKHNKNEYTLETIFNYYHLKKKKSFTIESKVYFMFDDAGKIMKVYGVD